MLPSVRSCAGQKVKSLPAASVDRVSFAEPLLFLYPRWFQIATHDQQCRSLHTSRCLRPRNTTKQAVSNPSAPFLSIHRRFFKSDAHARKSADDKIPNASSSIAISPAGDRSQSSRNPRNRPKLKRGVLANTRDVADRPKALLDTEDVPTVFNAPEMDGLELMRLLSKVPPKRRPRWHESRRFSARFIQWLTGTLEENMWFHKDGRGCEIEVLPPTESDPDHCQVLIYGSSGSQEVVLQYLKDQVVQFTLAAVPNIPSPADKVDLNQEMLDGHENGALARYVRVDELKIPTSWTIRTFYEYVTSIVNHRVPRAIQRALYPGSESYDQIAGNMLSNLFSNPYLKPYHSTAALRQALQFFRTRTQLAPGALKVWIEACEAGIVPDVVCFNREIERCLTVKNVARVQYLFYQMAKMWVPPNIETWCLVLGTMKGWTDRLTTISFLLRHRTASPAGDRQALARLVVRSDFARFVQDRTELHEFIEHMSKAFGSEWLSPSIVAEMIRQCLEIDKLETVSDILAFAHANNIKVEHQSSYLLMDAVRRTKDLRDCMILFKALAPALTLQEIQANVELLFKAAWKNSMPNMCRVLWHYAASHGSISYAMQKYIVRTVAHNATSASDDSTRPTKNLLAAITIGVSSSMDDFGMMFPNLYGTGQVQHVLEYLCRWTPNNSSRHEQHQLAHRILEQDLMAWRDYKPMARPYLLSLLDGAHTLDTRWISEGYVLQSSPAQILEQAIDVELEDRPAEQRSEAQERIDRSPSQQDVLSVVAESSLSMSAKDSAESKNLKVLTDTGCESVQPMEQDQKISQPYSLLSSSLSSPSFLGSAAAPAMTMANFSALDLLFQHLRWAWEAI